MREININGGQERPILLTGAHRSGTTWLANMLALSGNMLVNEEPFNPGELSYRLDGLADRWFLYAPAVQQQALTTAFDKVLSRSTGKVYRRRQIQRYLPFTRKGRLIIKDPIACFSSDWLYQNYDMDVVVIFRHPCAFVQSLQRMGWKFDFREFKKQPQLVNGLLCQFRDEINTLPDNILDQGALLWKLIYFALNNYAEKNKDWILVKHETLSLNPSHELKDLYKCLNLNWNESISARIAEYTSGENPSAPKQGAAHQLKRDSAKNAYRWQSQMPDHEIARIKQIVYPVAEKYYPASEWPL